MTLGKYVMLGTLLVMGSVFGKEAVEPDLVVPSYFRKGFGMLIREKVLLKFHPEDTQSRMKSPPPAMWRVYRLQENGEVKDAGVRVVFAEWDHAKVYDKATKAQPARFVEVVGYETIKADGIPSPSEESRDDVPSVAGIGWQVERVFVMHRILEIKKEK